MKRWIAFVLLLLVATTSVAPCCAEDDCAEEVNDLSKEEQKDENCSPFFCCTACIGFTPMKKGVAVPKIELASTKHFDRITFHFPQVYSIPVLQPPRYS